VIATEQLLSQRNASGKVVLSGVDLRLQTLVIIHQQFNAANVSRLFARVHLSDDVVHPLHQGSYEIEEFEKITSVGQFAASLIASVLQRSPRRHHFLFPVRYFLGPVTWNKADLFFCSLLTPNLTVLFM
jgi:hypothetical protein